MAIDLPTYGADRSGLNQDEYGFWTIVGIVAAFAVPALWLVLRRRHD